MVAAGWVAMFCFVSMLLIATLGDLLEPLSLPIDVILHDSSAIGSIRRDVGAGRKLPVGERVGVGRVEGCYR